MTAPLRFVALGDSYTIGTSVEPRDRWPDQLVRALGDDPRPLDLVANLAVNGWTSGDMVRAQLPGLNALHPEFVSLLVGVNDVVRGVPAERYRSNLETIFGGLLARCAAERILAVSTPDYTVTPAGSDYGEPVRRQAGIIEFNGIMREVAATRGVTVVDVFDLSQRAAADAALVATDGLHPSAAQYALWVERLAPVVRTLLARRQAAGVPSIDPGLAPDVSPVDRLP